MRPFYLLVVIFLVFLIVDFVYLPTSWAIAAGVFFLASAGVAFWLSLRLAKLNFEVKTASGRLAKIVDNLEDGVIAYDGDFKILVFNPAAERIFGLNQPEVLGQSFGPERVREARFRLLAQVMFPSLAPMVIPRSEPGMFPQVVDLSFSEPERQLRVSTDRIIDPSRSGNCGFRLIELLIPAVRLWDFSNWCGIEQGRLTCSAQNRNLSLSPLTN